MIRFLVMMGWEFTRYLRSRSFLLWTLLTPLVLGGIILVIVLYSQNSGSNQPRVIGYVELDTTSYYRALSEQLTEEFTNKNLSPKLLLSRIEVDTTYFIRQDLQILTTIEQRLDSLEEAYNKIKERRRYVFQRPDSRTKEKLLSESYDEFISTREKKDLTEIEYQRMFTKMDSLFEKELLNKADSLLAAKLIDGYLLVDSTTFRKGVVEFHSMIPVDFLNVEPLKQALQVTLVEERMREEGITTVQIEEFLTPIQIQEYRLEGTTKYEYKFLIAYLVPIVVVLFLFVSIFMSSGFLFASVISDKSDRVLEILLSSIGAMALIGAKTLGLGLLGLLQIAIWMLATMVLILIDVIPLHEVGFLTFHNAELFILYFILGYLFFASIFLGAGSVSSSVHDAHRLIQLMRILSIFPIVLTIFVLQFPDSVIVRILSFLPFLTPTFMVLRTPLGQPPVIDYYISVVIMIIFIILFIFFAGKIFRIASVWYDKSLSLKSVMRIMQTK